MNARNVPVDGEECKWTYDRSYTCIHLTVPKRWSQTKTLGHGLRPVETTPISINRILSISRRIAGLGQNGKRNARA